MAGFFDVFPKIQYDINKDGTPVTAVNIMVRYKIRDIILSYTQIMFDYVVKDGEKPFMIADRYYGRADLSELILVTNSVIDPYFDWPLSVNEFDAFIGKKYGSVEAAMQKVHSYWMIVQPRTTYFDGTIIEERKLRVDQTTYLSLVADQRKIVYSYDYEMDRNEGKRRISLISTAYISQIESELKNILK